MRRRAFSLIAHTCGCAILGILFLWVASRHLALAGILGPIAPFHTTDAYFTDILETSAGSERLLHALAGLPDNQPVAVVYREDDDIDMFIALSVMYFAGPKAIQSFPVRREPAERQLQALAAAPVSAAFFCGVAPPPGAGPSFPIGKGLVFVPRIDRQP